MIFRDEELTQRARKILGVDNTADGIKIKRAYRKKARQIHPDISNADDRVMGVVNQAYSLLTGKSEPTTLLENNDLVSLLIGLPVDPIEQIQTYDQWLKNKFYDMKNKSIYPPR